ncbi:MAG: Rieske 2Fe-2S domain-containing protein [Nitrospiraceae bacterium]|nr:Rieske 2Fe-2S domain-containing protein [Nitrospiraceae bacterium]
MNTPLIPETVSTKTAPLLGFWYPAVPSHTLGRGTMKALMMLGLPIVLCRDRTGGLAAMRDICPHRGMPLSFGRFDGDRVHCSYHGWQFDTNGRCRHIPALVQGDGLQTDKVGILTYPAEETDGMIWVYIPDERGKTVSLPPVPRLPLPSEPQQSFHISLTYTCTADDGIIGLIDPVHGPYVHSWWRSDARMHEKTKVFEPIPNGFRMVAHEPARNSGPFHWLERLYGGPLRTTIDFILPNQRVEFMQCGRFWVANRLMATPVSDMECRVDFSALWHGLNWVPFGNLIFRSLTRMFLGQDERAMKHLAVGLRHKPSSMFIGDADMPAKWYYKLKAAHLASVQTGQPMEHPLKERVTLRWRS